MLLIYVSRQYDTTIYQGTLSILNTLVDPGFPIGTPAVITIWSPGSANPCDFETSNARLTTAENRSSSAICTEWTPQAIANLLAVAMLDVTHNIGTEGRSRAARRVVEPEVV